MGSSEAALLPTACFLSTCRTNSYILCFIHTRPRLCFAVLFLHLFFVDPKKTVLLVSFLNHIQCKWEYPGRQVLACPGGVKLLVCLRGRARDSSRGQFSAGSPFQLPCVTTGGSSAFPLHVYQTWEMREKRCPRCW